jgi:hypothetical protein
MRIPTTRFFRLMPFIALFTGQADHRPAVHAGATRGLFTVFEVINMYT